MGRSITSCWANQPTRSIRINSVSVWSIVRVIAPGRLRSRWEMATAQCAIPCGASRATHHHAPNPSNPTAAARISRKTQTKTQRSESRAIAEFRKTTSLRSGLNQLLHGDFGVRDLFKVATVGVPGRVVRQKAKYEQADEEEHNNVYSDFKRQHWDCSEYKDAAWVMGGGGGDSFWVTCP